MVNSTVTRAETAGEMLNKLVPDIQYTSELIQEISLASREQSTGATQVNQAIQDLDGVTQQNSITSMELSTTAETLASQAERLQNAIAFFKIPEVVRKTQEEWTDLQEILKSVPDDDARNELLTAVKNIIARSLPKATVGATTSSPRIDENKNAKDKETPLFDMQANTEEKDALDGEFERY